MKCLQNCSCKRHSNTGPNNRTYAYLPKDNLVFEADGMFWYHHQDKEREAKRDVSLLKTGIAAVIHLTDEALDPWIPKE